MVLIDAVRVFVARGKLQRREAANAFDEVIVWSVRCRWLAAPFGCAGLEQALSTEPVGITSIMVALLYTV
jgi:hypothetical protein